MATKKMNIGLSLSRNFDKVTLEMIDEPIEADSEEIIKAEIRKRFELLSKLVDEQFSKIQK